MDGVIRIKLSELNDALMERIKGMFQGREDVELTIAFNDKQQKYYEALERSKKELEEGSNLISFTMEDLEIYSNKKNA